MSVINPSTNTVVDTITLDGGPGGVAVAPSGPDAGDVYVINGSDTVSVINPSTNTVVDTITVGTEPEGVAVAPAGPDAGDIYVTNYGSNTVSVIQP